MKLTVCLELGALGLASISFLTLFTNLEQVPVCTTLQVLQHNEELERMWYLVSTYCDTKLTNKSLHCARLNVGIKDSDFSEGESVDAELEQAL